ncbi:carboxypeptidase-like regulatory domain-containing protein [Leeuwenhoekiella sp. LLG6367-2.1]|uniref:carboxypeptidase-like regulatory domain-containing protein n=1 Tax=Leeuwenhoekiella sp. LLG6367-2.1 TaxID=3160833 RepID=UPI00386309A0
MSNKLSLLILVILWQLPLQGQITLSGKITETPSQNPVSAASILIKQDAKILAYAYSSDTGSYQLEINSAKPEDSLIIEVNSLGYQDLSQAFQVPDAGSISLDFELSPQVEELNTVVLRSDEKIKINTDTISYKVSAFTNETEQTVEDVLKNIPGIEIDDDGNIKAQGKNIQKILIEGDDLADRNYKVISKNLDAQVLDRVEVISNYDENPVLKQFLNSEAVVLNLKLKEKAKSIWFGNFKGGAGNDKRYLADLNLGLIRPEIKLLELANTNTTGKPAKDQRSNYVYGQQGFNDFDEDYETDFPAILSLSGNSILIDEPFYTENNSISSNLLGNKTIWKNTKLRNSLFASQDRLDKSYEQKTLYFLSDETINFSERNQFDYRNTNLSEDLEIRHPIDENNYLTLQTTFSISSDATANRLIFNNQDLILQDLVTRQNSGVIHLRYTKKIKNGALALYAFSGHENRKQNFNITPNTLDTVQSKNLLTKTNNLNNYWSFESNAIFKINKFSYSLGGGIINSAQDLDYNSRVAQSPVIDSWSGETTLKSTEAFARIKGQYALIAETLFLSTKLELKNINFKNQLTGSNYLFFNPQVRLRLSNNPFGSFSLSYNRNTDLPELNDLTPTALVYNYRSLKKGLEIIEPLPRNQYAFSYILSKKKKRILVEAGLAYSEFERNLSSITSLSENLNSSQLIYAPGSSLFTARAGFTTYMAPLNMSFKIGVNQSTLKNPLVLNCSFFNVENTSENYYFRGTTYWPGAFNFKFTGGLNKSRSNLGMASNSNTIYNAEIETIIKLYDRIFGNIKLEGFVVNDQFYETSSLNLEYRPKQKDYLFGIQAQNLWDTDTYTFSSVSDYQRNDLVYTAIPRYVMLYFKLRF